MDIDKATRKAYDATIGTKFYAYHDGYDPGYQNHSRSPRGRDAKRAHAKSNRRLGKALTHDRD